MRYLMVFLICISCLSVFSQQRDVAPSLKNILLNGDSISVRDFYLIKPGKVTRIDTIYLKRINATDTVYNIIRKPVKFLSFNHLKSKFNVDGSQGIKLFIDGYQFTDVIKFRIDKHFIRSIRFKDNAIQIRTKTKHYKSIRICRPMLLRPAFA